MTTEADTAIQSAGFLLELSPDWLILRASENIHRFVGEYPARIVGEPLSGLTLAQPLHDLRNSLARQRSRSGIAHAYRVRLFDGRPAFDFAFQMADGRILLEAMPSGEGGYGAALGAVSRLIDGLGADAKAVRDGAARRMRALTGFDRVTLADDGEPSESSRGKFAPLDIPGGASSLPPIIADIENASVPVYPRSPNDGAIGKALLRAPAEPVRQALAQQGVRSMLNLPLTLQHRNGGMFVAESRTPAGASFELHAAAELFAQVLALRLDVAD